MDSTRIHARGAEGETRAMRGLRLYRERGGEIVLYPTTGEYGVPSATEEGVLYVVSLEDESCDCASYRYTGKVCKHIYSAMLKQAERRSRGTTPARRSRRCSAPPMTVRSKMARDFLSSMGA